MQEEGAVLEELMGHLGEASGSIRAARRLLAEHASEDDPAHLRLLARLSEALDATETAPGKPADSEASASIELRL
jgi:hypothetical protein